MFFLKLHTAQTLFLAITGTFKLLPSNVVPFPQLFNLPLSPVLLWAGDTFPLAAPKCMHAVSVNDFSEHIYQLLFNFS